MGNSTALKQSFDTDTILRMLKWYYKINPEDAEMILQNDTTKPTLERWKTLGHLRSINCNMIIHFANQSQTCQLLMILKNIFFFQTFHEKKLKSGAINPRLNWYRKSISIIKSIIYFYIYRVGKDRKTVNTLTTLWCWFIVMMWALVCDNMYRYGRHFGSFYCSPTILETVSIAWVNTENLF